MEEAMRRRLCPGEEPPEESEEQSSGLRNLADQMADGYAGVRALQAEFFDARPPLYPWPHLLRKAGLQLVCKPREAFWHQAFDQLGINAGDRLLDVGCGTGIWLDRLEAEYGALGSGIDVSKACLNEAAGENETTRPLACGDVVDLPFASNVFDVVICLDVLEHIVRQERCLGELTRVLRPEGRLLLWTINRNQAFTWNWLLAKLGVDVFNRVSHDPLLLPKVSDTGASLTRAGLRLDRIELFNSFFTLLVDEGIMVIVSMLDRLGIFRDRGRLSTSLGSIFLVLTDALSRTSWRFLNWLDEPWRRNGYSNGFLIAGSKLPSRLDRSVFSEFASR